MTRVLSATTTPRPKLALHARWPLPHENREITLTTTWSGTATNPFTGETQTINGLVTTTETTGPFPLSHLVINNTDTWEEKQGH